METLFHFTNSNINKYHSDTYSGMEAFYLIIIFMMNFGTGFAYEPDWYSVCLQDFIDGTVRNIMQPFQMFFIWMPFTVEKVTSKEDIVCLLLVSCFNDRT